MKLHYRYRFLLFVVIAIILVGGGSIAISHYTVYRQAQNSLLAYNKEAKLAEELGIESQNFEIKRFSSLKERYDFIKAIDKESTNIYQQAIVIYEESLTELAYTQNEFRQNKSLLNELQIKDLHDEPQFSENKDLTTLQRTSDIHAHIKVLNSSLAKNSEKLSVFKLEREKANLFINPLWGKTDSELDSFIQDMDIKSKAKQLLMLSVDSLSLSADEEAFLKNHKPGGLILMGKNISDKSQTPALTQAIQNSNSKIPLIISVDQEGGVVSRIPWDSYFANSDLVEMSEQEICSQSRSRATLLQEVGINTNFAPVVDLKPLQEGFINSRTISTDASVIAQKAGEVVNCTQEVGIISTLKHFPGHGATLEDSHNLIPRVSKSKAEWLESDAVPFKEIKNAKMIMSGHLQFSSIDPNNPTTESSLLIENILRGELEYNGVVITDDMGQLHAAKEISSRDAIKASLNAGNDILLYLNTPNGDQDIVDQTVDLIQKGDVKIENVDQKLMRILKLKRSIR